MVKIASVILQRRLQLQTRSRSASLQSSLYLEGLEEHYCWSFFYLPSASVTVWNRQKEMGKFGDYSNIFNSFIMLWCYILNNLYNHQLSCQFFGNNKIQISLKEINASFISMYRILSFFKVPSLNLSFMVS